MYIGRAMVWNPSPYSQTLTSLNALKTDSHENDSSRTESLSFLRRSLMNSLSSGVTNSAVDGQLYTQKYAMAEKTTVNRPSYKPISLSPQAPLGRLANIPG